MLSNIDFCMINPIPGRGHIQGKPLGGFGPHVPAVAEEIARTIVSEISQGSIPRSVPRLFPRNKIPPDEVTTLLKVLSEASLRHHARGFSELLRRIDSRLTNVVTSTVDGKPHLMGNAALHVMKSTSRANTDHSSHGHHSRAILYNFNVRVLPDVDLEHHQQLQIGQIVTVIQFLKEFGPVADGKRTHALLSDLFYDGAGPVINAVRANGQPTSGFSIPIMAGSTWCHLHDVREKDLPAHGVPYGMWPLNMYCGPSGTYVTTSLVERLISNKPVIYTTKSGAKLEGRFTIVTHGYGSVVHSLSYAPKLGTASYQILGKKESSPIDVYNELSNMLPGAYDQYIAKNPGMTVEEFVRFIASMCLGTRPHRPEEDEIVTEFTKRMMDRYNAEATRELSPLIVTAFAGATAPSDVFGKFYILANMFIALLRCRSGVRPCENRDSLENKRLQTPGYLYVFRLATLINHATSAGPHAIETATSSITSSMEQNFMTMSTATEKSIPGNIRRNNCSIASDMHRSGEPPVARLVQQARFNPDSSTGDQMGLNSHYVQWSHVGCVCTSHTPESRKCGVTKNHCLCSIINDDVPLALLTAAISKELGLLSSMPSKEATTAVHIDARPVGYLRPDLITWWIESVMNSMKHDDHAWSCTLSYDEYDNAIRIGCENNGQIITPYLVHKHAELAKLGEEYSVFHMTQVALYLAHKQHFDKFLPQLITKAVEAAFAAVGSAMGINALLDFCQGKPILDALDFRVCNKEEKCPESCHHQRGVTMDTITEVTAELNKRGLFSQAIGKYDVYLHAAVALFLMNNTTCDFFDGAGKILVPLETQRTISAFKLCDAREVMREAFFKSIAASTKYYYFGNDGCIRERSVLPDVVMEISPEIEDAIYKGHYTAHDLVMAGVVQYLSPNELSLNAPAIGVDEVIRNPDQFIRSNYIMPSPTMLYGRSLATTTLLSHVPGNRAILNAAMNTQAITSGMMDSAGKYAVRGQAPLIQTSMYARAMKHNPNGVATVVGFVADPCNFEDTSVHAMCDITGRDQAGHYRIISVPVKLGCNSLTSPRELPPNMVKEGDVALLRVGSFLKSKDIIAVFHNHSELTPVTAKVGEEGRVLSVNINNGAMTVLLQSYRPLQSGDKLTLEGAQKHTVGPMIPMGDMIRVALGSMPGTVATSILSPHCIIGRMTVNNIIAAVLGHWAIHTGRIVCAEPFDTQIREINYAIECGIFKGSDVDALKAMQKKALSGGNPAGDFFAFLARYFHRELLADVIYRNALSQALISPIHYWYLRHTVTDKVQMRNTGRFSYDGQAVRGRALEGGNKHGTMETDSVDASGAFFYQAFKMTFDTIPVYFCSTCGLSFPVNMQTKTILGGCDCNSEIHCMHITKLYRIFMDITLACTGNFIRIFGVKTKFRGQLYADPIDVAVRTKEVISLAKGGFLTQGDLAY